MNSGVKQEERVSYVVEIFIQLKGHSKSNKTNSRHQVMNRVGLKLTFRNIQKIATKYHQEEDETDHIPAIVCFNLGAFENEIKEAKKITDFIILMMLDFIINNNLHSNPFDHTYERNRQLT
ncbi:hypothetical protein RFI_40392 [Reticulomyxa filosa]|uniref:Uncharacterized protein n=1 Tax=Reticulomyxa filosa TaxID=46433 RepID=X6L8R6_RETFI|nr:hypothetical protein RFI_40392 [Reticulomyxa filosa]|eukprot:ETN97139.1 hypothetical protein RFI_40392 [Reticulomyxa filosa]